MDTLTSFQLIIDKEFDETELLKGVYITVLHAKRIPPHIGLIIDKRYHSLTVKGQDKNVLIEALLKNIRQRKIATLFIKVKQHATFSNMYMRDHFLTNIKEFPRVDIGVATCLSPVKSFFEEVYGVQMDHVNFLYELLPKLYSEGLIENVSALFTDKETYRLPVYSAKEIDTGIEQVRNEFKEN